MTVCLWEIHTEAGAIGGIVAGLVAGGSTFVSGSARFRALGVASLADRVRLRCSRDGGRL